MKLRQPAAYLLDIMISKSCLTQVYTYSPDAFIEP